MGVHEDLLKAHISVTCDQCGAEPGDRCITKSGNLIKKPHAYRIQDGTEKYMEELQRSQAKGG